MPGPRDGSLEVGPEEGIPDRPVWPLKAEKRGAIGWVKRSRACREARSARSLKKTKFFWAMSNSGLAVRRNSEDGQLNRESPF